MEYLSKEEVKQWRSSLEKITLEEYARRLGKAIQSEKETNDMIDLVMSNPTKKYMSDSKKSSAKQTVVEIARQTIENEEIGLHKDILIEGQTKRLSFNKPLTEREQKVLDYFIKNRDVIVYAKDLAKILGLPTDYVYKYIKNLRAKIIGDVLQNAVKGGYKLAI